MGDLFARLRRSHIPNINSACVFKAQINYSNISLCSGMYHNRYEMFTRTWIGPLSYWPQDTLTGIFENSPLEGRPDSVTSRFRGGVACEHAASFVLYGNHRFKGRVAKVIRVIGPCTYRCQLCVPLRKLVPSKPWSSPLPNSES